MQAGVSAGVAGWGEYNAKSCHRQRRPQRVGPQACQFQQCSEAANRLPLPLRTPPQALRAARRHYTHAIFILSASGLAPSRLRGGAIYLRAARATRSDSPPSPGMRRLAPGIARLLGEGVGQASMPAAPRSGAWGCRMVLQRRPPADAPPHRAPTTQAQRAPQWPPAAPPAAPRAA